MSLRTLLKESWLSGVLMLGAFWASGSLISVQFWDDRKAAFLVALSVVAAAVLIRLARGMPITNTDFFDVQEIRVLAAAVRQVMRSLQLLIFATLTSMIFLIVAKPLAVQLATLGTLVHAPLDYARLVSGFLGLLISYVLIRVVQVVRGDYDLVELQANYMVRAVERREAKRFEDRSIRQSESFKTPEGYGKRLQ